MLAEISSEIVFNEDGRMARRHRLDIFADILKIAKNGTKKTNLVYKANSNFTVMSEYLHSLTSKGFIETSKGSLYTTDRGLEFLEKFEELMVVFNSIDNGKNVHGFMKS